MYTAAKGLGENQHCRYSISVCFWSAADYSLSKGKQWARMGSSHRWTASSKFQTLYNCIWQARMHWSLLMPSQIVEHRFLAPVGKSKDEVEQEVISGRFPPCILYKIVYNSPEEIRVRPALMKVYLHGADAPLSFSCRVKEETCELCLCCMYVCVYV